MSSGTIAVSWGADGSLKIQSSVSVVDSHGKKFVIDKLLDAARAINNSGTSLVVPATRGVQILGQ